MGKLFKILLKALKVQIGILVLITCVYQGVTVVKNAIEGPSLNSYESIVPVAEREAEGSFVCFSLFENSACNLGEFIQNNLLLFPILLFSFSFSIFSLILFILTFSYLFYEENQNGLKKKSKKASK